MALDNHCLNSYALIVIPTLSARHVYTTRLNEGYPLNGENEVSSTTTGFRCVDIYDML
jgi:hypothetical protein